MLPTFLINKDGKPYLNILENGLYCFFRLEILAELKKARLPQIIDMPAWLDKYTSENLEQVMSNRYEIPLRNGIVLDVFNRLDINKECEIAAYQLLYHEMFNSAFSF